MKFAVHEFLYPISYHYRMKHALDIFSPFEYFVFLLSNSIFLVI